MPLDPRHSRIIKHAKLPTVLATIPAAAIQGVFYTLVPFLFNHSPPKPMRTSAVMGAEYIHDVMYCGNPKRIQEILRMKLEVFQFLCSELKASGPYHSFFRVARLVEDAGLRTSRVYHPNERVPFVSLKINSGRDRNEMVTSFGGMKLVFGKGNLVILPIGHFRGENGQLRKWPKKILIFTKCGLNIL